MNVVLFSVALIATVLPLVLVYRKARTPKLIYETEKMIVTVVPKIEKIGMPGDMIVFDWRGPYLAESLGRKDQESTSEWVEVLPGDPGLLVTVTEHSDKPYLVLLGRQNKLVHLSATMIKRTSQD